MRIAPLMSNYATKFMGKKPSDAEFKKAGYPDSYTAKDGTVYVRNYSAEYGMSDDLDTDRPENKIHPMYIEKDIYRSSKLTD